LSNRTPEWKALSDEPDDSTVKRGSRAWKMNIAKGHNKNVAQTLCCPYCLGEGWIQNPGSELRVRRQDAGVTQREFVKICGWSRTSISEVERGLRPPNPQLVSEYRKLVRIQRY
jgi:DNA-binding XRE family transcriptional regulator